MEVVVSYRKVLWERALDQHGLVTTRDAHLLGVPSVELRKLRLRGALDRIGQGVYRMADMPTTDHEDYAVAVALVGRDAYLTHDAVLAMHDLGQVNPRSIRVGTPHRVRATLPPQVTVVHRTDIPAEDLTVYDDIPSTTVARALLDSRDLVMRSRLHEAAERAAEQGLVSRHEHDWVIESLPRERVGLGAPR
jgi:predicted transcriptional regulator of viral defense system